MVEKRSDAKWSDIKMPFEHQTIWNLNSSQMDAILFSYVLVLSSTKDKPRRETPNHLKFKLQKVLYSNVSIIQVVGPHCTVRIEAQNVWAKLN